MGIFNYFSYFLKFYFIIGCTGFLLQGVGFSLWWLLLLRSTGARHVGSVVGSTGARHVGSVVVA